MAEITLSPSCPSFTPKQISAYLHPKKDAQTILASTAIHALVKQARQERCCLSLVTPQHLRGAAWELWYLDPRGYIHRVQTSIHLLRRELERRVEILASEQGEVGSPLGEGEKRKAFYDRECLQFQLDQLTAAGAEDRDGN